MPHHPLNSPEALLPRSDSKNPSSTCRGITAAGTRCRRDINVKRRLSSASATAGGVVSNERGHASARYYCWQHQDQARSELLQTLQEADGVDNLVERMGSLGVEGPQHRPKVRRASKDAVPKMPLKSEIPKRRAFWRTLCYAISDDADPDRLEIVRHKQRTQPAYHHEAKATMAMTRPHLYSGTRSADARLTTVRNTSPKPKAHTGHQSTSNLLELFPSTLSPRTTSALLAELSKPISAYDEPGYIYIFWLTDSGLTPPPPEATSSLLSPKGTNQKSSQASNSHQQSAVLSQYATGSQKLHKGTHLQPHDSQRGRILLKIGRANNVHRRMSEWERQCGYNISLLRFYPHVPTSRALHPHFMSTAPADASRPQASRSSMSENVAGIRKVPFAHRVERLIHIELSEAKARVRGKCSSCGREHREWFEVEATRDAIRRVDEVVQRWVGWAERKATSSIK